MPDTEQPRALERYRSLARTMDARFRIPGTPIRFGWDAILGLIPGIGDALGGMSGGYGLWVAYRLGAPPVVLLRLLFNVGVDLTLGTVPLLGDLFDLGWRSNQRNLRLIEAWHAEPHRVRRRSGVFFGVALGGLVVLVVAAVVGAVLLLRAVAAGVAGG